MSTTLEARANHYEILGLSPDASQAEIKYAFAREISSLKPRAFGGLADVSIAYGTLSDPARRLAYDASLGIDRRPPPPPTALQLHLEMHKSLPPRREDNVGAFIAAALRSREQRPSEDGFAATAPETLFEPAVPAVSRALRMLRPGEPDQPAAAFEWKRPGLTIGALFAGAALIGITAGLWSQKEIAEPATSASVELPDPGPVKTEPAAATAPVRAMAAPATPAAAPTPLEAKAKAVRRPPQAAALAESKPDPAPSPTPAPQAAKADPAASQPAETAGVAADASSGSTSPTASQAAIPLPAATVAATIRKIGYSCGQVTSQSPAGDEGVFIVTCSSGESYRAAPVNGRYRFKRLGKR